MVCAKKMPDASAERAIAVAFTAIKKCVDRRLAMQASLLLGSSGRSGRRAREDMMRALMIAVMTTMLTAVPLFAQERGGEDANGYVTSSSIHRPVITQEILTGR
jgi:hypothetical protein